MAFVFYYASGSPYAWRVWLALEHKEAFYELRTVSFDAGDLRSPAYSAINPRQRVPAIEDDGFALYESAAIVDYVEDKWADRSPLFSPDVRLRALQRRIVREADQYFADAMERLVDAVLFTPADRRSQQAVDRAAAGLAKEFAFWEPRISGDYLTGQISAADYTLYPMTALVFRIGARNPGTIPPDIAGPSVSAWMARMAALPIVQKTWPPHWLAS